MTDGTKYKPLIRAQSKLIDTSMAIFSEQATKKDAAFLAQELVQATLPVFPAHPNELAGGARRFWPCPSPAPR